MEQVGTMIQSFLDSQLIPLGVTAIGACIVVMGFAFLGTRESKQWGRTQTLYVIAAAVCIYLGTNIAQSIASSFNF